MVISPDESPERALDDNKTFQVVWSVLRALRSHDDRFDLEINSLDLNNTRSDRIIVIDGGDGEKDERDRIGQLSLDLVYKIPPGAAMRGSAVLFAFTGTPLSPGASGLSGSIHSPPL